MERSQHIRWAQFRIVLRPFIVILWCNRRLLYDIHLRDHKQIQAKCNKNGKGEGEDDWIGSTIQSVEPPPEVVQQLPESAILIGTIRCSNRHRIVYADCTTINQILIVHCTNPPSAIHDAVLL